MSISNVLVVCTANVRRSPIAAAVLSGCAPWLTVKSAGLHAQIGHRADPDAVGLLAERGVDLSSHRAQQLNRLLCEQADLIFVMDSAQKAELERRYSILKGRVFRLGHHHGADIADAHAAGRAALGPMIESIEAAVERWSAPLSRLAGASLKHAGPAGDRGKEEGAHARAISTRREMAV
jgi:protein-tyrosine phosphatase